MAATARIYYTTDSRLSDLGINDGQIIFTSDTQTIYLDMKGKRLSYSTIRVYDTDADRSSVLAPVEGYYYVEETHVLWRYKNKWIQITPSDLEPVVFYSNESSLPTIGVENKLYCTDNAIYNWKQSSYNMIVIRTEWETI